MNYPICPNCEKEHSSNDRFCSYCGEDLEEIILAFKEKQLPVSFNNNNKRAKETFSLDEAEERRQEVLRIKEEQREHERTVKAEEQKQRDEYEKTLKRKPIPTIRKKRMTCIPPIVVLILMIIAMVLANEFAFEWEALGWFFGIMMGGMTLFILAFIPYMRVTALIRSRGLTTSIRKAPKPPKSDLDECADCCASFGNC